MAETVPSPEPPGDAWIDAYERFETPHEEIRKFESRLRALGADAWPRDAAVLELFCGRGNGLHALSRLGFRRALGADISAALLSRHDGATPLLCCDARALPLRAGSTDIVVIQGGLHHLDRTLEDLELTLAEVHRVLRAGGRLAVVEPWPTFFLSVVHLACSSRVARRLSRKLDALAVMIEHERRTYEQWLASPGEILAAFGRRFEIAACSRSWGKLRLLALKR